FTTCCRCCWGIRSAGFRWSRCSITHRWSPANRRGKRSRRRNATEVACTTGFACPQSSLSRAAGHGFTARKRGLGCCQTGYRHTIGRAGNVVHPDLVAELDGARFAAVLAADPDFEIFAGSAAQLGRHLDELADAFLIEHRERVGLKDFGGFVVFLESRIVVAGETHGGLREVVGAEGEELGLFGDL